MERAPKQVNTKTKSGGTFLSGRSARTSGKLRSALSPPFASRDGGALAKQGETASPSSGASLREDAGGEGAVGEGERREGGKTKRGDFFTRPPFIAVSNWFNRSSKSYTGGASWGLLGEALSPTNQGKTASPSW